MRKFFKVPAHARTTPASSSDVSRAKRPATLGLVFYRSGGDASGPLARSTSQSGERGNRFTPPEQMSFRAVSATR